jgi:tellurite resistance protein
MELLTAIIIFILIYQVIKAGTSNKKALANPEVVVRFEGTRKDRYLGDSEKITQHDCRPAVWYGVGQSVTVQGYNITGGMIYIGEAVQDATDIINDPCLINLNLEVSPAEPWDGSDEMNYYPYYSLISPKCRGAYLKWLAGGRSEPEAYIGYVFLFFYGLERRLFVDGQKVLISDTERAEIVSEVNRLLQLYGGNHSFRGYASNFLAMEWVLYQQDNPIPDYLNFSDRYCSQPFQVVIAKHILTGNQMSPDLAYQWLIHHPEYRLKTSARRCQNEFKELFSIRYKQRFGDGIIVEAGKTPLIIKYQAASLYLRDTLNFKIPNLPNPFVMTAPLSQLSTLVEECTVDLEPFSRYVGRKDNNPKSLAALVLLPRELLNLIPTINILKSHLAQVSANGIGFIQVENLFEWLGEIPPLQIAKKESENLAVVIEKIGFGMAPDVRFHDIKLSLQGKVAIFQHGYGIDFCVTPQYRILTTILRLGAMISQIDEDISITEETTLKNLVIKDQDLTQTQKDSLLALLQWYLYTPQITAGIKKRFADISADEKNVITRILISIAFADGLIDPREVRHLEKLYLSLGFNKEQVTSDIHSFTVAHEPITVCLRDLEPDYSIPKPPVEPIKSKGFSLNEELIRIRTEETLQVRDVLQGIFSDPNDDQSDNYITTITSPIENPLTKLDKVHQDLLHRLLEQEAWARNTLQELCREFGLMVDGAMEVLNEWSYENANTAIIDDGDPVFIDINLAREIINVK